MFSIVQTKTYGSLNAFYTEMKRVLRKYVTHPDIRKLLFDLPGQRVFLPPCPDLYIEAMTRLFDFDSSPGKCLIRGGTLDLFDVGQEVLVSDPFSLDMPASIQVPSEYGVVMFNFAHDAECTRTFLGQAVMEGFEEDPTGTACPCVICPYPAGL